MGQWVAKGPPSTFFPDAWTRAQVLSEIRGAFADQFSRRGNYFEGISQSGVRMGGYHLIGLVTLRPHSPTTERLMIAGRVFVDQCSFPRAEYLPPNEALGWYLEQDVQASVATCDLLLQLCRQIGNGSVTHWEGVGNSHAISISRSRVAIRNEFSDVPRLCELSLGDFQIVLEQWKQLLLSTSTH